MAKYTYSLGNEYFKQIGGYDVRFKIDTVSWVTDPLNETYSVSWLAFLGSEKQLEGRMPITKEMLEKPLVEGESLFENPAISRVVEMLEDEAERAIRNEYLKTYVSDMDLVLCLAERMEKNEDTKLLVKRIAGKHI